jgi:hypothetical protein
MIWNRLEMTPQQFWVQDPSALTAEELLPNFGGSGGCPAGPTLGPALVSLLSLHYFSRWDEATPSSAFQPMPRSQEAPLRRALPWFEEAADSSHSSSFVLSRIGSRRAASVDGFQVHSTEPSSSMAGTAAVCPPRFSLDSNPHLTPSALPSACSNFAATTSAAVNTVAGEKFPSITLSFCVVSTVEMLSDGSLTSWGCLSRGPLAASLVGLPCESAVGQVSTY